MKLNFLLAAFSTVILAGCQTTQQSASTPYNTVSGKPLKMAHINSVNPDCSPRGNPIAQVLSAPTNGKIIITNIADYPKPGFPPNNEHYRCNKQKIMGLSITYKPDPGFVGTDSANIGITYSSGRYVTPTYRITVR